VADPWIVARRWLAFLLLLLALVGLAAGWALREFTLLSLFLLGGGVYILIHAIVMLLSRKS
jgi:uncharacterized membrane protein (Fun14 family)